MLAIVGGNYVLGVLFRYVVKSSMESTTLLFAKVRCGCKFSSTSSQLLGLEAVRISGHMFQQIVQSRSQLGLSDGFMFFSFSA